MSSIDKITDTTMKGLQIGVLAGVTGGIMRNMNNLLGGKRKKSKKKRRK